MKAFKSALSFLLIAASFCSCNKVNVETGSAGDGTFKFLGQEYATLQEALDAVTATPLDTGTEKIVLTGDRREDGATIDPDYDGYIGIDFGRYTYSVNRGQALTIGNATVDFTADGGAFNGDIIIEARGDAEGIVNLCRSFKGTYNGSVSLLGNARLNILSENAKVTIPQLSVKDAAACVNITCTPVQAVRIEKVVSPSGYPVCAFNEGAAEIGTGALLHVHSFTDSERTPASDNFPAFVTRTCYCGFEYREYEDGAYAKAGGELILGEELPVSYLLDRGLLHSLDDVLNWQNEYHLGLGDIAIAGLVLSIIALVETAVMTFIPGWTSDEDEQWLEVNGKLDQIKTQLEQIEKKIDALSDKIDAVSYKELAMERNSKFNFLRTKSTGAFQLISNYFKDETLSKEEKTAKILSVIKDWSANVYGGTSIADLTQNLMQQYTNTGIGVTIPEAFEGIANLVYLWEHEGYNFRYQALAQDVLLSSISCEMALLYISSVKEYNNEDLRKIDLESMQNDYLTYSAAVKAELERIKTRDALYRRYNRDKITFSRDAVSVDFHSWFEKHRSNGFPRENSDGKAAASCNQILRDLGLEGRLAFTSSIAKTVYTYYNKDKVSDKVSIYKILKDTLGFHNIPSGFDPGIVFTWNNSGFGHLNDGDVAYPVYRIFSWESHRGSSNNDFFGIRTCLNNSCGEENHNILYKCDISSYSDGKIEEMGERTRWNWYAIVTAE